MTDEKQLALTRAFIAKDFELKELETVTDEASLKTWLADHIAELLQYRFEYLMNVLYRLDVDEDKMRWALAADTVGYPNVLLANIIIERQKQKAITRMQYASDKPTDNYWLE